MNKEVENLIDLYTKNKEELLKAIKFKVNFINHKFILLGLDKFSNNSLAFLNNLKEGFLKFNKPTIFKEYFIEDEVKYIEYYSNNYRTLELYNDVPDVKDINYFIELDFNKLELTSYYKLFPNFYHTIPFNELDIDLNKKEDYEIIKCLIIKKTFQNLIILEKNNLVNDKFYAPIISKIFYKKDIDNSLLDILKEISNRYLAELVLYANDNLK